MLVFLGICLMAAIMVAAFIALFSGVLEKPPCNHVFSRVKHETVSYSDHHSVIIDQCILCKEKRATLIAPSFTTTLPLDLAERTLTGIDVKA